MNKIKDIMIDKIVNSMEIDDNDCWTSDLTNESLHSSRQVMYMRISRKQYSLVAVVALYNKYIDELETIYRLDRDPKMCSNSECINPMHFRKVLKSYRGDKVREIEHKEKEENNGRGYIDMLEANVSKEDYMTGDVHNMYQPLHLF